MSIHKYGLTWANEYEPLDIEFHCIRKGAAWCAKNGTSLFDHYKAAQMILWPDDHHHRWSDLTLKSILDNQVTVLMGPGDSNKTYSMVRFALVDFFAFPNNTLSIVSSTDSRGLELRIWGKMKDLFNRAKEFRDDLPGVVVDYLKCITPDEIDESGQRARTINKGIICVPCVATGDNSGLGRYIGIKPPNSPGKHDGRLRHYGDECFPAGTLVDTPSGPVAIEKLKVGDSVLNCLGECKVTATMKRTSSELVKIKLRDGRQIVCTPNHPILTKTGWANAIDIHSKDVIVSTHEAMSIMWGESSEYGLQEILQSEVSKEILGKTVQGVRHNFLSIGKEGSVSFQKLQCGLENEAAGNCSENDSVERPASHREENQRGNQEKRIGYGTPQNNVPRDGEKSLGQKKGKWGAALRMLWGRSQNDQSGGRIFVPVSRSEVQLRRSNWTEFKTWKPSTLQAGLRIFGQNALRRIGWKSSLDAQAKSKRLGEGCFSESVGVDSVEIYKQGDASKPDGSCASCEVYNLSVSGHPSYSVNGLAVHNCQAMKPTFLDAYSNWMGKPDFKGVMSGNPTDTLDPLGKAAEPLDGWDNFPEPKKTTTWRSRFYNACVVNLVGSDSPNFDYDRNQPPKFPELISWLKIEAVAKTWGKDSIQYYSQCIGVMKPGFDGKRVITRELCRANRASEQVIWDGGERTQVYAIDPAYGGGDRCSALHVEFGVSTEGVQTILMHEPKIIPINVNLAESPEEQIARFVYADTVELGIPSENIFYDAFGKGTVGFSFAKVFGLNPPVPVESGGSPSARPVRHDLFVTDKNGTTRLKRCDEHYKKKISELWFSVRYIIECGQMRGMTQETIDEGCLREYMVVENGKFEVESKKDMKERIGRSPDLMDVAAIACEGCRQRGFKIRRLNEDSQDSKPNQLLEWYLQGQKKAQQDRTRYALKRT